MKKQPKSVRHIINAFIELRASRPLEKIMITELCEKADINKSTFYAYFKDIYDLSDQLEEQVIKRVLESLPSPELITSDPAMMTRLLVSATGATSLRVIGHDFDRGMLRCMAVKHALGGTN